MSERPPTRRRDAATTRRALLEAASKLFAERGFERTTVREIASEAGVNQALLFRYFGSKEALFEEVTAVRGRDLLATAEPSRLLEHSLRGLLSPSSPNARHRAVEALLRSVDGDSDAAKISKELGDEYAQVLATLTNHADADLRADLVLAWLVGIGMLRGIGTREALANADADRVCELVLAAAGTMLEEIHRDR